LPGALILLGTLALAEGGTAMRPGEYWYAMVGADGEAIGYARMRLETVGEGGVGVDWELKIVYGGSPYEERRTLELDAARRTVAASYTTGNLHVEARRDGTHMKGRVVQGAETDPIDVEVDERALPGMGFVLAAELPLEAGAEWKGVDVNEAQGFAAAGGLTLRVVGRETVELESGPTETWRVELATEKGRTLPVWVDAERRIVQVDWGQGSRMRLRAASTEHLFRPPPPAFEQVAAKDRTRLALVGDFEGASPKEMFALWTTPEGITSFWPPEAEIDARVGGRFHMIWRQANWFLRGEVTKCEPGAELAFTWKWDHTPNAPVLTVSLRFEALAGGRGTRIHLAQAPYTDSARDQGERDGHLQGWQSVGARLRAALESR